MEDSGHNEIKLVYKWIIEKNPWTHIVNKIEDEKQNERLCESYTSW